VLGSTVTRTSRGMTTLAVYACLQRCRRRDVRRRPHHGEPHRLQRDHDARVVEVGRVRGGQLGASPRVIARNGAQCGLAERGADVGGVLPLVEPIHELSVHGPGHVDVPGQLPFCTRWQCLAAHPGYNARSCRQCRPLS
jgi:hypothetical protein